MQGNGNSMDTLKTMKRELKLETFIVLFSICVVFLISWFSNCGTEETVVLQCPTGYSEQNGQCKPITDGELVCGASRRFQINFINSQSKAPVTMPIDATLTQTQTLQDENGTHRLNDSDGVYLFDNIILCDEYFVSVSATCYENREMQTLEIPLSTIYTMELTPKLVCGENELDIAFDTCLDTSNLDWGLCCNVFPQAQFDLTCGRFN